MKQPENLQQRIEKLEQQNDLLWRQISAGKKRRRYIVLALAVAIPLVVFAASIPNTFVDGEIISAAKINANFQAAHPDCPSGFTDITNGTYSLGCLQTAERSDADCNVAILDCFDTYGGRLPTFQEIYIGFSRYALSQEDNDSEWVQGGTNHNGTNQCDVITSTAAPGAIAFTGSGQSYRCFIPR